MKTGESRTTPYAERMLRILVSALTNVPLWVFAEWESAADAQPRDEPEGVLALSEAMDLLSYGWRVEHWSSDGLQCILRWETSPTGIMVSWTGHSWHVQKGKLAELEKDKVAYRSCDRMWLMYVGD